MADSDIYNLEFLSLVAKITQEIDNHIGINDKTAAEFLINLHEQSNQSLAAFKAKVKEVGTEFPDSFIENVDRLILSMHPKYKKLHRKSAKANGKGKGVDTELGELERKKRLFPGLAVKDKEPPPLSDEIFLEELGDLVTGRKTRPHPTDEPSLKRQRRGRSPSPRRRRDEGPVRSAKRLTSPERWEIKQLISSGAIDASEYPDLDEDFNNPMAHVEIEEELDVEIREDEPPFLAGQTKRTLDLSPVKIVKAPDGSLNRAALAGASLAKERRELRQQEANEEADSQARDFSQPWLDPMSKEADKIFAQDLRGNLKGQKSGEVPSWKRSSFNKTTTFGEITSLSIQDQRKSLPIYKLREPLLKAIEEVSP